MKRDHVLFHFFSANPVYTMSMPQNHSSAGSAPSSFSIVKIIRYAAVAVLVLGALYYSLDEASIDETHKLIVALPKPSRLCKLIRLRAIPQFFRR